MESRGCGILFKQIKGEIILLKFWKNKKISDTSVSQNEMDVKNIEVTTKNIKNILSDSSDINYQVHYINRCMPVTIIFIDGLVDLKMVDDDILKPLSQGKGFKDITDFNSVIDLIEHDIIYHASRKLRERLGPTLEDILNGSVALVFDKEKKAITFNVKESEKRSITEPTTENALKGAKDSFIEDIRVNTSLVRRKLRTPYLRIKEVVIGRRTRTPVAVIYIEHLTNEKLVKEVFKRLEEIDIDGVITAGNIEEYIIDYRRTMFPQIMNTERTDKFCHNILEGRVGMIIDGLPVTYIIPGTFAMFFQAPEDYAQNYVISSYIRCLRYICSVVTLLLPGFYVAITTFHQEMIPTVLAVSIIKSKVEVPFPTMISIIMMLIAFEILLEAGLRLPKAIGQAVSIIGALVVGQAAVQAKLISPVVVIIVAATGICGFVMPNQDMSNAFRLFRLLFVISASISGLYGLSLTFVVLVYHLSTIETFGIPYLSPFVANEGRELMKDTLIRIPLFLMKKRPSSLKTTDKNRQKQEIL